MVFLGLEKPVEYGAQQIFDPTMANMVLQTQKQYNDAARQEFYRGLQDIKDFQKEYGDFITPILADQDWYNRNVTGKVRDFINSAYERGIDLTRSPEGRAAITQLINSIPVGEVAKLRTSAKNAEEYLKNRGKLEAAGLYNPDLEERYLKYNLANWDTINNDKIWTRTSPTEMKTLKEVTESWYNNRTPEILNQADVESFNMKYDPRYNYTGFADRHLLDIAAGETPGWRGSLYADYYRDLAEQKVAAKGFPYTKDDVERQLQQDIATANREYRSIKRDADDFAKLDQQHRNAVALENLRHKNDMALQGLKNAGKSGSGQDLTPEALGPDTSLATDAANKYITNKQSHFAQYATSSKQFKESDKLYGKLLERDKEIAYMYKLAKDILKAPNATAADVEQAKEYIRQTDNKKDANFVAWRNSFNNAYKSAENDWNKNNTVSGIVGYGKLVDPGKIYNVSKQLFDKNHRIEYNQALYNQINNHLPYLKGDDGAYAIADGNVIFQPVALLNLVQGGEKTGHMFKHNSDVSKIARAIKGKKYYEDSNNIDRQYGSGSMYGSTKNVINETVIFKDKDIVDLLSTMDEDFLKSIGITPADKGEGYKIPITHVIDQNMGWADVDSRGDKAIAGASTAGKRQATNQARVLSNK